jgi:hypothetical protein
MNIQEFFSANIKEIVSLMVPILGWFFNSVLKPRAKLNWGVAHAFTFIIQQPLTNPDGSVLPTQTVRTVSITVANSGKETATNAELVFNWKPEHMNIWPARHYDDRVETDSRYTVMLNSLAPQETINFECLTVNNALPDLVTVRCDQCSGIRVPLLAQQAHPRWKIFIARFLLLAGITSVIYVGISILQFLVKSPS